MGNLCEICGAECLDEVCPTCQYQIDTGDTSDIWKRVQEHDNSEYDIDQVKIAICKYYGCDPDDIFKPGRHKPETTARHLFYYILHRRFKWRHVDICKQYNFGHCTMSYICNKFDKKFNSNIAVNKYLELLKY